MQDIPSGNTQFQFTENEQQLLRQVIPLLEHTTQGTFQARQLLAQGIPLAQAVRVMKLLEQAGILGPAENNCRSVNYPLAGHLLTMISPTVQEQAIQHEVPLLLSINQPS